MPTPSKIIIILINKDHEHIRVLAEVKKDDIKVFSKIKSVNINDMHKFPSSINTPSH